MVLRIMIWSVLVTKCYCMNHACLLLFILIDAYHAKGGRHIPSGCYTRTGTYANVFGMKICLRIYHIARIF